MNVAQEGVSYLAAFLGGIWISFSPCVYPLIPITAGYIGVNSVGSRVRGLILSLAYVTGIAITYSLLGLIASLTGTLFGRISTYPLTYFLTGAIIIFFGLSMLDLFHLPFFGIASKTTSHKRGSIFSAFLFGLNSGLIISPCLAPVLGSILVYLATKKNIIYGMTLLLTFAYGMGIMLIVVGIFSGVLLNWPKLGRVMVYIKRGGAIILIIMGLYFISLGLRRM